MNKKQPHKSTTHDERYIHITNLWGSLKYKAATIFARQENGEWFMAVALCWKVDQFCRATGRQNARRNYFKGNKQSLGITFEYDKAVARAFERIAASEQGQEH